jgi:hypothetical protein
MSIKVVSYLATLPRGKTPESIAKNQDKSNTLRYFVQGVNAVGDLGVVSESTLWEPSDVAVILGWVHEHGKTSAHLELRRSILENQARTGGRTIIADSNLFLYQDINNPGYWLRYSYDNVFPGLGEYCDHNPDPARWKKVQAELNIKLKPWRTQGHHVLVCLQRDGGWSMRGFDVVDWALDTIAEIRGYSNRPIVIRSHPGDKRAIKYCQRLEKLLLGRRVRDVSFSQPSHSLLQDLSQCWAVVNHNSSPTVAAAIEGIPIFVTDPVHSQAREVANTDFALLENPAIFERTDWIERLSQFHWSHRDLQLGHCWQHMRKWAHHD